MKLLFKKLLGIFVPFMLLASGPVHAGKFDGITIRVLSRPGPVISGAVDMRGKKFTELTGAKVIVLELPFSELFNKVLTDWSQGTNSIDAAVTSSAWVPELVDMGLVADLSDFVANDPGLKLDVLNRFSQEPPTTWDEWFEVAKAIHGKDYNGDGEPDYASCAFKKRATQSYFTVWSVASAFIQTKGTSQGVFFDTKTGKPSLPNPGFAEGLRVYKEMGKYGPADELNMDIADIRALYLAGRCAMVIEWGDTSPLALESDTVRNLWGASQMLGSTRVWNRDTNRLEQCNPTLCPHAINGVNHAPFGAFGGWSAYINKNADPKVIQAAYEFFSYMNAPEQSNIDVTQGWTGFTRASAAAYLNGMKQSLSNPNFVSDLRIPGAAQYTSVILDTELARYLAGEINEEQTMANIAEAWEEVTEDFGREKQMKLYRATLGLKAHY